MLSPSPNLTMRSYIVQRLLAAIPTLFGITVLIFLAMRVLPGDPFLAVGGAQPGDQAR